MFETVMFLEGLEKFVKAAHQNSKDKGFWEGSENQSLPVKIALMHSELSELLEAYRAGFPLCNKQVRNPVSGGMQPLGIIDGSAPDGHRPLTSEEEEVADVFIRLADYCGFRGIDLGRVALAKMGYNRDRSVKHGGKKI